MKGIVDSDKTNHERTKYMLEVLYAVHQLSQEDKDVTTVWKRIEFMQMIYDMLENQLRICVEPFNILNCSRVIALLFQSFQDIVNICSVGKSKWEVRVFFYKAIIHFKSHCPDPGMLWSIN